MKWSGMVWSGRITSFGFGKVLVLATAVLLLTAACLGGGNTAASPYSGAAVLECSAECMDRGQCGTAVDGTAQVLSSSAGPTVEGHDLAFPAALQVTINSTVTRTVETIVNQQQFPLPFYQIQLPDGRQGWVAEWCLAPVN